MTSQPFLHFSLWITNYESISATGMPARPVQQLGPGPAAADALPGSFGVSKTPIPNYPQNQ
jgi:hypothetical protein